MLRRIEVQHINVGYFACRYTDQLPGMLFPQSLDSLCIQGRIMKAVRAGRRLTSLAPQTGGVGKVESTGKQGNPREARH